MQRRRSNSLFSFSMSDYYTFTTLTLFSNSSFVFPVFTVPFDYNPHLIALMNNEMLNTIS